MGLPKKTTTRRLTEKEQQQIQEISELLGCNASISSINLSLQSTKAQIDLLRGKLGLDQYERLHLGGMIPAVDKVREANGLEIAIQDAMKAYPFKRAELLVAFCRVSNGYQEVEATLWARESQDRSMTRHNLGPFTSVQIPPEPKMFILDRNVAATLTAAVKGLTPKP